MVDNKPTKLIDLYGKYMHIGGREFVYYVKHTSADAPSYLLVFNSRGALGNSGRVCCNGERPYFTIKFMHMGVKV